MTAPKRMVLAFACMILGILCLGLPGILVVSFRDGPRYALPVLQFLPVYLLFAFPGYLLALPFILLFRDAKGRRGWIIVAIGTAIGPSFIGTWTLLASHGRFSWHQDGAAIVYSVWIGLFTTVFYVVLLRRLTND